MAPQRFNTGRLNGRVGLRGGGGAPASLGISNRLGTRTGVGISIKSRLGGVPVVDLTQITDARQKINLNKVRSGRIRDAREKIQAKQMANFNETLVSKLSLRRGAVLDPKSIRITSDNPYYKPPRVVPQGPSGMYGYGRGGVYYDRDQQNDSDIDMEIDPEIYTNPRFLTRTVSNPQALQNYPSSGLSRTIPSIQITRSYPPHPTNPDPRSYQPQPSYDDEFYFPTNSNSSVPRNPPPRESNEYNYNRGGGGSRAGTGGMASRLSSGESSSKGPTRHKVYVSNLQESVTANDIVELFSDVGNLASSRIISPGKAEAWYETRRECLKAVEVYHNRLLDGSPMRVRYEEQQDVYNKEEPQRSSLRSQNMKVPKGRSESSKVHPDLSAIHKVLFQPTTSSNIARNLFKGKPN